MPDTPPGNAAAKSPAPCRVCDGYDPIHRLGCPHGSPEPKTAASPYVGSHNLVGAGVAGIAGTALLALIFASPWLALAIVSAAFLGGLVGLHVQAIREAEWQERQRLRRLGHAR